MREALAALNSLVTDATPLDAGRAKDHARVRLFLEQGEVSVAGL